MDIAIVTGAETPLGLSLIQRLIRQGYRVHGIGNNFSKVTYADPQFAAHPVDLSNLAAVTEVMQGILDKEKSLDLLIHAIDVTPGADFEKLSVGNLEAILKIGLLGPVMLTRLALPNLLRFRGQLINVIPANKSGCPASAVNALLEGGLREMNRVLFDRARDAGLRVTNLVLRQNPEPDGLSVKSSEQTHIDLEDVARSVEQLIDPKFGNVPAELVLHPRASAQSDQALPELPEAIDPYSEVVLPPKEYCPPKQPKIPTQEKQKVDRTIPYTDDEMEDKIAAAIEDFEAHPERYDTPQPKEGRASGQSSSQPSSQNPRDDSQDGGGSNKRRRGRRRGGRNRNRDRDRDPNDRASHNQGDESKATQSNNSARGGQSKDESSNPQVSPPKTERSASSSEKSKRPARRERSKPDAKPDRDKPSTPDPKAPKAPKAEPAKKTPVKKLPAKKAAKKAVKKTSVKKVAKKVAAQKTARKKAVKKTDS